MNNSHPLNFTVLSIRIEVDLRDRTVVTLAGTGIQGYDLEGGLSGRVQPISSPWDVALGKSPGKIANSNINMNI